LGKNKKLKDVITSSMSTIVDRTCCFFFLETKQDETAALSGNTLPEPLEHEINGVE
jgi:hypothetical protein